MKKVKALSVGVMATLAFTVLLGVSSAPAAEFKAEEYPAILEGTGTNHSFKTKQTTIGCGIDLYLGGTVFEAEKSLEVIPVFEKCPATVDPKGCEFVFEPGSEIEKGIFAGAFSILPAGCGPMTISFFSCVESFPSHTGLSSVTYTNKGEGSGREVTIEAIVTKLKYTLSGKCNITGTFSDGVYEGTTSMKATSKMTSKQTGYFLE